MDKFSLNLQHSKLLAWLSKVAFWMLLTFIFSSTLRSWPMEIYAVSATASVLGIFMAVFYPGYWLCVLGFSLCYLPYWGSGVLPIFAATSVFIDSSKRMLPSDRCFGCVAFLMRYRSLPRLPRLWMLGSFLITLSYCSSLILSLLKSSHLEIIVAVYRFGGALGLYHFLSVNRVAVHEGIVELALLVTGLQLGFKVLCFSIDRNATAGLFRGFCVGIALSLIMALLQRFGVTHQWVSLNYAAFWQQGHRVPGSLSDPNAFGILFVLLVPGVLVELCPARYREITVVSVATLVLVSFLSGSRAVLLALALWFSAILVYVFRRGGWAVRSLVVAGVVLCVFAALLVRDPGINHTLVDMLPSGAGERLVASLAEGRSPVDTRVAFWKIALGGLREQALVGHGLGRYQSELVRLDKLLDAGLDGWVDNANSYYLEVLFEQGLVGFFLVVFGWTLLCSGAIAGFMGGELQFVRKFSFVILVVLLAIGPHFDFAEVLFATLVLLGHFAGLASAESGISSPPTLCRKCFFARCGSCKVVRQLFEYPVVLLLLTFLGQLSMVVYTGISLVPTNRGLYDSEFEGGIEHRWSVDSSSVCLPVDSDGLITLDYRLIHPDIHENPVEVQICAPDVHSACAATIVVNNPSWHEFRGAAEQEPNHAEPRQCREVDIRVSRLWSPSQREVGWSDRRWLGAQLRLERGLCQRCP